MAGNQESKTPTGLAEPAPHFLGHRERLRERFLKGGSDALADYELIELVQAVVGLGLHWLVLSEPPPPCR